MGHTEIHLEGVVDDVEQKVDVLQIRFCDLCQKLAELGGLDSGGAGRGRGIREGTEEWTPCGRASVS